MGWWGRLGNKIVGGVTSLGKKVVHGVKVVGQKVEDASKWAIDHAGDIKDIAGKVEQVAGVIGSVATKALPFTAEIPIVGEVVGGVAGIAKGVEAGAGAVKRVAGIVQRGKQAYDEAEKLGL